MDPATAQADTERVNAMGAAYGTLGTAAKSATSAIDAQIAAIQKQLDAMEQQKPLNTVISAEQTNAAQQAQVGLQLQVTGEQAVVLGIQAQIDATNRLIDALAPVPNAYQQALDKLQAWNVLTNQEVQAIDSPSGLTAALAAAGNTAGQFQTAATTAMNLATSYTNTQTDAVNALIDAYTRLAGSVPGLTVTAAPGRAAGGPVAAGGVYTVGEHGPELFAPTVSGAILPNSALLGGSGGGGAIINVTVSGNTIASPADENSLAAVIADRIAGAWRSGLSQGSRAVNGVSRP